MYDMGHVVNDVYTLWNDVYIDMRHVVNDVVWGKNNVVRHRQRHGNVYDDVVRSGYDVV